MSFLSHRSFRFLTVIRQNLQQQQLCRNSSTYDLDKGGYEKIGNRDFVGYGINGQPNYFDMIAFPMPSVRFKENTPDVMLLREKEKGDWNKLSIEEKKALYRASFCQTFAEVNAPNGDWKVILGSMLIMFSFVIWVSIWMSVYVYPPFPDSFKPENREALIQRMIDMRVNPVQGFASNYDYEKMRWKD